MVFFLFFVFLSEELFPSHLLLRFRFSLSRSMVSVLFVSSFFVLFIRDAELFFLSPCREEKKILVYSNTSSFNKKKKKSNRNKKNQQRKKKKKKKREIFWCVIFEWDKRRFRHSQSRCQCEDDSQVSHGS